MKFDQKKMLKQVQKVQQSMERIQKELAEEKIEVTVGGGVVKVVASGQQRIVEINIAPEVVNPEDIETLVDLLITAINSALEKSQELAAQKMSSLTGGLMPGLF